MDVCTQIYKQLGSISVYGKFDFHVHRDFKRAYMDMLNNPLIHEIEVEMRHLDFIDSSALGMLMLLRERAHAVNKSIVLSNPTGNVFTLLEVANFDKMFPMKRVESSSVDTGKWSVSAA